MMYYNYKTMRKYKQTNKDNKIRYSLLNIDLWSQIIDIGGANDHWYFINELSANLFVYMLSSHIPISQLIDQS